MADLHKIHDMHTNWQGSSKVMAKKPDKVRIKAENWGKRHENS